jgi:hypothetical protein
MTSECEREVVSRFWISEWGSDSVEGILWMNVGKEDF